MLHAAISNSTPSEENEDGKNTSSRLVVDIEEIKQMKDSLEESGGSFTRLFEQTK